VAAAETGSAAAFPLASVSLEQNATDGDAEVVFQVTAGSDGLAALTVVAPDGRPVVVFKAPDSSTLGIRQFRFESPEPRDPDALRAAYPAGVYRFSGKTASGGTLSGQAQLHHRLPATTSLTKPSTGAERVSAKDVTISWSPVPDAAAFVLELEQSKSRLKVTAVLPGTSTSFAVPPGLLLPGETYKLAVGTVSGEGNVSYLETTFTTARE
jgi:hypothetical protein